MRHTKKFLWDMLENKEDSAAKSSYCKVVNSAGTQRKFDSANLNGGEGLLLAELEKTRWKVAPQTAASKLAAAGLPVAGRRAGLIYSWKAVFRAEGVDEAIAEIVTRETHPDLFENLLTGAEAAEMMGVKNESTIRKYARNGIIPEIGFVTFGARGVRRFRPLAIAEACERKRREHLKGIV